MSRVLIIGGCGRIGNCIAQDLLQHAPNLVQITITGRNPQLGMAAIERLGAAVKFRLLDLSNLDQLQTAIADADLVLHAAGPFSYRDGRVLQTCIEQSVDYVDVSDERQFTHHALALKAKAEAAGVTAVINTGVFPGISNSLARQGVEQMDKADSVQLSYLVSSSGEAGLTVMRTTFIGLQRPFTAWIDGQWQEVKPYTGRETLTFPAPHRRGHVYWYDMPEAVTLPTSFPVRHVITKFGVVPDFYNHMTWMMAHWLPSPVLKSPKTVEALSHISYRMTRVTDRISGTGVAVRCDVKGETNGQPTHYCAMFAHPSAAAATGHGAGILAQLILAGKLKQPGVWPVEQVLTTEQFQAAMRDRKLTVQCERLDSSLKQQSKSPS
jgi:saccharopine dehydrogenase-like NADP-dependent oxidoreductase